MKPDQNILTVTEMQKEIWGQKTKTDVKTNIFRSSTKNSPQKKAALYTSRNVIWPSFYWVCVLIFTTDHYNIFVVDVIFGDSEVAKRKTKRRMLMLMLIFEILLLFAGEISEHLLSVYPDLALSFCTKMMSFYDKGSSSS